MRQRLPDPHGVLVLWGAQRQGSLAVPSFSRQDSQGIAESIARGHESPSNRTSSSSCLPHTASPHQGLGASLSFLLMLLQEGQKTTMLAGGNRD